MELGNIKKADTIKAPHAIKQWLRETKPITINDITQIAFPIESHGRQNYYRVIAFR